MADDGSRQSKTVWPIPAFRFEVQCDGAVMVFQEVCGLDMEAEPVEYRHGNSPRFSVTKMPGTKKYSDVTMKKGIFKSDNTFRDWFSEIEMNTIKRMQVTIRLLDETGSPTMVWTLSNAWPTKMTATDLKAEGNEVAVETITLSHEGLSVANG